MTREQVQSKTNEPTMRSARLPRVVRLLPACAVTLLSLGGCWSSDTVGRGELVALGSAPLSLEREFITGAYISREADDSFWFSDVPLSALLAHDEKSPLKDAVILHAQLIWEPKPGMTPLDPTATNVVTRIMIISDGEVGLYGGAGFSRVEGLRGKERVTLEIEGGTLTLLEKTAGFHDLLSPAGFSGTLTAELAPDDATRWRRAVSQFATNAFGKSLWVDASTPDASARLAQR
jgi:hypothetical protein